MATKRIKFTKSPTGRFNLAYFDGDVVDMPQAMAEILIEAEYAVEVHSKIAYNTQLPADVPQRDKLILAGIKSLEELKEYHDFTEIDGIGVKSAKAIEKYLKK